MEFDEAISIFAVGIIFGVIITGVFVSVFFPQDKILIDKPCASYANEKVEEIPARCLPYFMGVREYKYNVEVI